MGANPHANGGQLLRDLVMPDFRGYAVPVTSPGATNAEDTRVLGRFLRDVIRANETQRNFRVFGPDETSSNRLDAVFEVTNRTSEAQILPSDDHVARDGRVYTMSRGEGASSSPCAWSRIEHRRSPVRDCACG